jgi:UDP-N-acetylmuramoylalanine--D-glutamate ligase
MITGDELHNKRIAVLGAGVSGKAIAELASKLGASVFVSDSGKLSAETAADLKAAGITWEDNGNTTRLLDADEIVISSGISPDNAMLKEAALRGIPVVGELDFVYPYLSGTTIAVTGSNGKTTTASMTGYLLDRAGYVTVTAGNIGNPIAKAAGLEYDFIVLELSSFQLYWADKFRCDVAIVTNLAPDHINWHGSYEKYVEAKSKIIKSLYEGGAAIIQKNDVRTLGADSVTSFPLSWGSPEECEPGIYMDEKTNAAYLSGGGHGLIHRLFSFSDVKLLGAHNLENTAMATAALSLFNINITGEMISSYVPPKHRCAFAGETNGIIFVDDSKGTNVAATVTAMRSLPGNKIIILGGQGKGEDYAPLADAVVKYTTFAVLLGEEKERIASALKNAGYSSFTFVSTMDEAVETAYSKATLGDTILLSPACTSWDMYPNYGARGEHFCSIVKSIISREK